MKKHLPNIISNCSACPYAQSIDTYNEIIYHCNYSNVGITDYYKSTGIHPKCKLIDCKYVELDEHI